MPDDKNKVVGIRGHIPPPTGQPNEYVLGMLAELKELAENGRIVAIAVTWEGPPEEAGCANCWYRGYVTFGMVGRIEKLKHDLLDDIKANSTE